MSSVDVSGGGSGGKSSSEDSESIDVSCDGGLFSWVVPMKRGEET